MTESEIHQTLQDLRAAHAQEITALERLFTAKHDAIAAAHGASLAEEAKARRAAEQDAKTAKKRAEDAELRAGKGEKDKIDLEGKLATAKAEAATAAARHAEERQVLETRLQDFMAIPAPAEAPKA